MAIAGYPHRHLDCLNEDDQPKFRTRSLRRLHRSGSLEAFSDSASRVPVVYHEDIRVDKLLGKGSFSEVYSLAGTASRYVTSEQHPRCAIKLLRPKLLNDAPMFAACSADLVKEGLLLSSLNHEHIIRLHAWAPCGLDSYAGGKHDAFFLVLERLHETLGDRLAVWREKAAKKWTNPFTRAARKQKQFQERLQVGIDLAEALVYMHDRKILHRDLKPHNVGFTSEGVLKLFDFDVARRLPTEALTDGEEQTFKMTRRIGSPRYMSPECGRGEPYNLKSDVYSYTILLHELVTLNKPFQDLQMEDHKERVLIQGVRPQLDAQWPRDVRNLFLDGWTDSLSSRLTMRSMYERILDLAPKVANSSYFASKISYTPPAKSNKKTYSQSSEGPGTMDRPKLPTRSTASTATMHSAYDDGSVKIAITELRV